MRRLVVILSVLALAHLPVAAQSTPTGCTEISGKTRPDLIPDDEAIRMAFMMLSDGPSSLDWKTRVAFFDGTGLTQGQVEQFLSAANCFRAAEAAVIAKSRKLRQGAKTRCGASPGGCGAAKAQCAGEIEGL
jgi:hypothetical protein